MAHMGVVSRKLHGVARRSDTVRPLTRAGVLICAAGKTPSKQARAK